MRDIGIANPTSVQHSFAKGCALCRFFIGRAYPALICLLVLLGHILSLELASASAVATLASAGLLATESILPAIAPILTLVFTLSRMHSPGIPSYSDYLFSDGRPIALALLSLAFLLSVAWVLASRIKGGARLSPSVMLPVCMLCAAFVLNGAFCAEWSARSLVFGIFEALVYLLPAIVFCIGLDGELERAADYFAYVSTLCVLLLSAELLWLYIGPDTPLIGGESVKSMIVFGWGIWTSAGAAIAVLIPAAFVGVIYSRRPYLYLSAATLAMLAIYATHSRGALIFGAAAYFVCLIAAARLSRIRRACLAIILFSLAFGVGFAAASWQRLPELISALLSDNGRFRLWEIGISEFLSSPLFGTGFFGFEYPEGEGYFLGADFLPPMLHGTPVQLLGSMGIFGTATYAYYRISTALPLVRDPDPERLLVFFSGAMMLLISLVENYVFQFWPTLHYSVAIAVSRLPRRGNKNEK